jgi:hypothetical protein
MEFAEQRSIDNLVVPLVKALLSTPDTAGLLRQILCALLLDHALLQSLQH